jgi:zinc transporter
MNEQSNGLILAYLLDGKGGGKKLDWTGVSQWQAEQGVLWIHLDYENKTARDWIQAESQLDEVAQMSLLAEETRPRCASMGEGVLLNLRGVNTNPGSDAEDMVSIRLYCDAQRVVSTRKRRLLSVVDIGTTIDNRQGPKNAGELITTLAARLTERMSEVVSELDDAIDGLEEEVIAQSGQSQRARLSSLRRVVIMLRRYIAPQREALSRLQTERVEWFSDRDRISIRETADRLARYIEELDSCRDRAAVAHEELASRLAEELNSRMYVLSIVAALFLPLGFLTGLFGINVGGIPMADNPLGFILTSVMMLVIVVAMGFLFKLKKWL